MEWRKNHKTIELHKQTISYVDTEQGEEALLILHEFGSSSYDYHRIIDSLKKNYRVIIPDLIGFGYSSKPKHYFYTAKDQASLLTVFLKELGVTNLSIMGQGFGVSVLNEMKRILDLGFINLEINEIFIINSRIQLALTRDKADLEFQKQMLTSYLLKLSLSYGMFKKQVKAIFFKEDSVSETLLQECWEILNHNNGIKTMNFIENYILESTKYSKKQLTELRKLPAEKFIIWGKSDDIQCEQSYQKINKILNIKSQNSKVIEECGYFPMLEKPEEFTQKMAELKKSA